MLAIESYELANGLRVVLNEDHSAPLVALNLWYHVGSKNERPGRTGFAHLFEHMLFSGSEHVGNNEHFRYVQSVGGVLNGTTFFDRTNYFEMLPSTYLALGLWLESDRMGFFLPALTQEKLDIQREVVKEERRQRYDNVPYGTAFERLLRLAYEPDYSYHWPTIGSMQDLEAASLDDIQQFFATWYRPDNCVLTLVGDFAPDEAKKLIEKYFGDIVPGGQFPQFDRARSFRDCENNEDIRGNFRQFVDQDEVPARPGIAGWDLIGVFPIVVTHAIGKGSNWLNQCRRSRAPEDAKRFHRSINKNVWVYREKVFQSCGVIRMAVGNDNKIQLGEVHAQGFDIVLECRRIVPGIKKNVFAAVFHQRGETPILGHIFGVGKSVI